ncbi:MAG: hypothetical protein ACFBRM_01560 [Pikeienuella sp.]
MDCHTPELLGWQLSRSGKVSTAAAALELSLIPRVGTRGRVATPFLLRSENGLVFTSRNNTRLVWRYRLYQSPRCAHRCAMSSRPTVRSRTAG